MHTISTLALCGALFCTASQALALSDINGYEWQASIQYLQDAAIIDGYPDGTFKPEQVLNRAELTKIVIGATFEQADYMNAADDCFSDVRRTDWFAKYVCFAKEQGIVKGYPDNTFRPSSIINQAEGLKIVLESFYDDIPPSTGEWYERYFDEASYLGMYYFGHEDEEVLHPLTRGEMSYFVAWNLDEDGELEDQIPDDIFFSEEDIDVVDASFDWGPMSPEDCLEDEEYDAEDEMCYVIDGAEWEDVWETDEDWGEEDEPDEDFLDEDMMDEEEMIHGKDMMDEADISDWDEELEDWYDEEYTAHDDDEPVSDEDVIAYHINGESITLKNTGNVSDEIADPAMHQQIWKRVTEVIPSAYRKQLAELHIFTDGEDDTHAYVASTDDDRWILAIDAVDAQADPREFTLTIIHEFGHTLTLGVDQIDFADAESFEEGLEMCKPRFFTGDGCARQGSFIDLFFQRFWTGKMLNALKNIYASEDGEASYALYESNPSRFITEYAASDVSEDVAESFAYFVFHDRPEGNDEKYAKIRFFEEFPSLVKLRKDMRAGIVQ